MKCRAVRRYLSPYLDSALDATTTYEISRHVASCADCARLFGAEEELDRAIFEHLRAEDGDEGEVFERALGRALPAGRGLGRRRILVVAGLAAAGIVIVLVGALGALRLGRRGMDSGAVPDLLAMVASDHTRYLAGELEPELRGADRSAVAAFLAERLAAAVGPFPDGPGWELDGARICRFQGARVGFVSLRTFGRPVSVVDVPGDPAGYPPSLLAAAEEGRCFELEGGRGIARLTPHGIRVAFGDVETSRLEEVVAAAR